ncbi:TPA: ABC transporter substrate-binding protein [Pseudomonas aeruginosa]
MKPCSHIIRIPAAVAALSLGLTCGLAHAEGIEIGLPIPITGPYAVDGKVMEQGAMLAVEHLNAQGGVLGQPLSARVFDIGDLTPDKLQAAAAELIERRQVTALINGYGGMGPDIPAFCKHPQPYLNNNATTYVVEMAESMGCDNVFMAADVERSYGRQVFAQLEALGHSFQGKRIAVLYGPYDWEVGFTGGIREAAEASGWSVTLNEEVPYGTSQWAGTLNKLRAQKPDLVVLDMLDPASVATFLDQMRRQPLKGSLVFAGYSLATPALAEVVAKGGLDGVLGMTLSAQRSGAEGEAFEAAWQKTYGEPAPLSIGVQVYDEVMAWAAAVQSAGSATDYAQVKAALAGNAHVGVTGTLRFNERRYVPASDATQPVQLLQAQGGVVKPVMVGSQSVNPFVAPTWLQ